MYPNFLCSARDVGANINLQTYTRRTQAYTSSASNRNCWQAYTLFRREIRQEQIACRTRAHTQFMQIYKYIFKLTISGSISFIFLGDMLLKFQFQQHYQQSILSLVTNPHFRIRTETTYVHFFASDIFNCLVTLADNKTIFQTVRNWKMGRKVSVTPERQILKQSEPLRFYKWLELRKTNAINLYFVLCIRFTSACSFQIFTFKSSCNALQLLLCWNNCWCATIKLL